MDLIKSSINEPAKVAVGVLIILIFGFLGLKDLPYQLTPDVTKPEISIRTDWYGATPYEIEREIIEEQEKVLKSIPGLETYESSCKDNSGTITLTFPIGTDLQRAIIEVTNKLNEINDYPENVDKPVIKATGESSPPIVWTILQTTNDNENDIDTYATFFENKIREKLERIDGVAEIFDRGGTKKELHVTLDNEKLASYNLTITEVINILQKENVDISAGTMDISRRSYRIRTASEFGNVEDIKQVVLKSDGAKRVFLTDVADIVYGYHKKDSTVMSLGKSGIIVGFKPIAGTNVVELTDRIEKVIRELNDTILKENKLQIIWLQDLRKYINGSIDLVQQNILMGSLLAIAVLLLFLRSITSTAVIAIAIPISIFATFIVFEIMGRSLNIISLAGISFAVGMLVDSAIVVLENIDRHRKMGKSIFHSAYDGTQEVWGALIASALTTVAVFVPIIFLQDEAGQLFKDIAIAVSASVTFSLFVSVFVVPMIWTQLAKLAPQKALLKENNDNSFLVKFGKNTNSFIMKIVKFILSNKYYQVFTVVALAFFSVYSVKLLFPKMEYLPQGNKNLVYNILIPPPGFSYEENKAIGEALFKKYMPYTKENIDGYPKIQRLFYISRGSFVVFGATAVEEDRAGELIPLFMKGINSFPSVIGISKQSGVFERGLGKSNTINVDISGEDLNKIVNASNAMFGALRVALEGARIRPNPSIELLYPEVNIVPNRDNLKALGLDSTTLGISIDVLMDGRKIGEFKEEAQKKIDLIIKSNGTNISTPEELYSSLIATKNGLVPISSIADIQRDVGISEIRHFNGKKTITLEVTPTKKMTIEETMDIVNNQIVPNLKQKGLLDGLEVRLSGTADQLSSTINSMKWSLIIALIITYLLMVALFSNFIYPIIIMFTVPLATAGGFIGIKLTDMYIAPQSLDVLTMLGFVILIGTVVNNAILIVHQSLNYIRIEKIEHKEAIIMATHSRLRPIFMSTLTSIVGMLPLVFVPGPGAEFYRGLGSVITGGLALSTVFTIFVIPALLMFVIRLENIKGIEDEKKDSNTHTSSN